MSYVKPTFLRYIRLFLLVVFLVPTFLSGQQAIWMEAIESWEKDVLLTPDDKIARLDSIREVAQREAPQPGFFLRLHQFLARQYYVTQRYDSAAHHFEQNRQWAARQSDQAEWMRASWNAAHMFLLQGKLAEAQTRYLEIHHHYSLQQDTLGLAEVSGAIGNVYFQNQAYGQALDRYQAAMRWWSHIEEVRDRFFTLHQMAKTYQRLDSLPQAEYWYRHLLAQYTSLLPFDEKFLVERNLSAVMRQQGKYRQALSLQLAAYHRNKASLDEELSMMIHHSLGLSYRDLGRYDSALCYLDLALEYVAQKKQLTSISLIEESRYSCLSELGRFREALQALERHIAIEDSLFTLERSKLIQELEDKYQHEKHQKALQVQQAQLEKGQLRQKLSTSLALFFAFSCLGLWWGYQQQKKLRLLQTRQHQQTLAEHLQAQESASLSALLEGQELERQRIARELHDRIGSLLATIKLYFSEHATPGRPPHPTFTKASELLSLALQETRQLSHSLSAQVASKFGLIPALQNICGHLRASGHFSAVEFQVVGVNRESFPAGLEIAVFRIAQEGLQNIIRHAQASHISLELQCFPEMISLMIEDNGQGFSPDPSQAGMGITNMRQRARQIKGSLFLDSQPGQGCTLILEAPLPLSPKPASP